MIIFIFLITMLAVRNMKLFEKYSKKIFMSVRPENIL